MKRISNTVIRNALRHEQQIIKLIEEGLSAEQISIEIGTSWATLSNYCRVLGIKMHRKQRAKSEASLMNRINEIIQMRKDQKTLAEIGEHYGVSRERIRQILAKAAPDVAIAPRIPTAQILHKCPVCQQDYNGKAKTCSPACRTIACKRSKWNRDMMLVMMDMRGKGHTWNEIRQKLKPEQPNATFRIEVERQSQWFLSTDEFVQIFNKQPQPR